MAVSPSSLVLGTKSYLFLHSGNRNRQLWPNPAVFQVPFGGNTRLESRRFADPVAFDWSGVPIPGVPTRFANDPGSPAVGVGTAAAGTANTITLDAAAGHSLQVNIYVGYYVVIFNAPGAGQPNQWDIRRITAYSGATRIATIDGQWAPVSSAPAAGVTTYVVFRGRDQFAPLRYFGSLFQQPVCFECSLAMLTVPNTADIVAARNLYVQITTQSMRNSNIIWNNTPMGIMSSTTFVVPVSTNARGNYFYLQDTNMTQTIKFKPDDDIIFSVHYEDGTEVNLAANEGYSPQAPDPDLQVTALFEMQVVQRLTKAMSQPMERMRLTE